MSSFDPYEMLYELIDTDADDGMQTLMKYLGEKPERWVGAVAALVALNASTMKYRDLANENKGDTEMVSFFMGCVVDVTERLIINVGSHPVAQEAWNVLRREHPKDAE
jgi:hypothetical protein